MKPGQPIIIVMSYLETQSVSDAYLYEESVPIFLAILVRFKERIFLDLLKRLQDHNHGWVFSRPVDPVELELYDYFDVIEKPMDLGTIEQKCHAKEYHHFEEFQSDVHLTFDNAMEFFNEKSTIYQMAVELKNKFDDEVNIMVNGQLPMLLFTLC